MIKTGKRKKTEKVPHTTMAQMTDTMTMVSDKGSQTIREMDKCQVVETTTPQTTEIPVCTEQLRFSL